MRIFSTKFVIFFNFIKKIGFSSAAIEICVVLCYTNGNYAEFIRFFGGI